MLKSSKVYWKMLAIDPKTKRKLRRPWLTVDYDRNWSNEDKTGSFSAVVAHRFDDL